MWYYINEWLSHWQWLQRTIEMKFSVISVVLNLARVLASNGKGSCSTTANATVTIQNGTLSGFHLDSFNQDVFLGIPFAQPPVGALRFEAPVALNSSWQGIKPALTYGNSCVWIGEDGDNRDLPTDEDCLTLNVVRPAGYEDQPLPVGIWIYGGGFNWGASSRDLYNLSYPVQQSVFGGTPILAVSINYRTTGFGFLASNELNSTGGLNAGLKDQRLAIQWVKENVAAFGGDPNKITIWGESAGGISVAAQLTAYGGKRDKHMFQRGIMESGSSTTQQYYPMNITQAWYNNISTNVGCGNAADTLACLKNISTSALRTEFNQSWYSFGPVVDGDFIPKWPKDLIAEGSFLKVPVISGNNLDEGTSFGFGNVNTTDELSDAISTKYPTLTNDSVQALLNLYPNIPSGDCPYGTGNQFYNASLGLQYKRGNSIGGDIVMVGPRRLMCDAFVRYGVPVYSYDWNETDYGTPATQGATHFQEVVYVFDNPSTNFTQSLAATIGPDPSGNKTRLAELTSRYFMSFIATGNPNNAYLNFSVDPWPEYSRSTQNYYFSSEGSHAENDDFRAPAMNFINYGTGHQLLN